MFTWQRAIEEAKALAGQLARSQYIAESMRHLHIEERFVIGPARGWAPDESIYNIRAHVRDSDLSLYVFPDGGWEPPVASAT